jgi:hypothetical protein
MLLARRNSRAVRRITSAGRRVPWFSLPEMSVCESSLLKAMVRVLVGPGRQKMPALAWEDGDESPLSREVEGVGGCHRCLGHLLRRPSGLVNSLSTGLQLVFRLLEGQNRCKAA